MDSIYFVIWTAFKMANEQPVLFTSSEYTDMLLIYGETRSVSSRGSVSYNARLAARFYSERYREKAESLAEEVLKEDPVVLKRMRLY